MKEISIPLKELDFSFSRSSGSGGQNVNKVNSKVTLRWNIKHTKSIASGVVERFCAKYKAQMSEDGTILIRSEKFRTQDRNVADCIEKLQRMINLVAHPPKKRHATKPSKGSVEKRLKSKRTVSEKKKFRRSGIDY